MDIKSLPHNDDCESTVLGTMLLDPKSCLSALTMLNEDDFYFENVNHRAVFRAMKDLNLQNLPIDIHTVGDYLNKAKILSSVGGVDYLVSLTDRVTGFTNLEYYATLLKDYSLMRSLISTVDEIRDEANKQKVENFSAFVGEAEARLTKITAERRISGFESALSIAKELGQEIESMNSGTARFGGITTGYKDLDNILNGLQKGSLIVLAARPSVGKTALGLNIAYNAAQKTNRPVAIFSLEMSNNEIMKRLFANRGTVQLDRINKGFLSKDDRLKLKEAETEITKVPLYIDDTGGINLDDLVSKAKKLRNDLGDLAMIVVDYIGIVTVKLKTDSMVLQISRVTSTLKQLARTLDIPVLALAQVNRHVEDRDSAIPELSNLKDSGSIEQDADQVMFIYNPNQITTNYKKINKGKFPDKNDKGDDILDTEPISKPAVNDNPDAGELIRVLIKKNRNGRLGEAPLLFFKAYQRFDTPSEEAKAQFNKYISAGDE